MDRPAEKSPIRRALYGAPLAAALAVVALAASAGAEPPPPGQRRGPPPEAFTACEDKARGDVCTVHIHDTDVEGTCDAPPNESRLACRPNHPPPPPPDNR